MQKTTSPKAMLEGALLAAITALLALIGTYLPFAGFFTFLVVAIPIIVAVVRNNLTTGIMASLVALFLVGILAGPIIAIVFYLQFMILALVYGVMFKNKNGAGKILVVGTFIAALSMILIMILSMAVSQVSIEEQKQALFETVDRTIQIYERHGMMDQFEDQGINKEELRTILTSFITTFLRVLPSLLIIGSVFTAITNFLIARLTLKKLGYTSPSFPAFSEWRMPWYLIWGLIGGWGSFLLGDIYKMNFWTILGQNIMIAYGLLFFVLGLSVVSFFFKKYRISRFGLLLIVLTAILVLNITVVAVIFIGMFDLVLDIRKKSNQQKPS